MPIKSYDLRNFLDKVFPDREKLPDEQSLENLAYNLSTYNVTLEDLYRYWERYKDRFSTIEEQFRNVLIHEYNYPREDTEKKYIWREDGAVNTLLELNNDQYWSDVKDITPRSLADIIRRERNKLTHMVAN